MNDERLDNLLQLLRQTEVQPPLVPDSRIKTMMNSRRLFWIGLACIASLGTALGITYVVDPMVQHNSIERSHPSRPTSTSSATTPMTVSDDSGPQETSATSVSAPISQDVILDPRSILTLSLTDDELRPFGIQRYEDSISVRIQTFVVADTQRARTLGLTSAQLCDTMLLFHRSYSYKHGGVPEVSATNGSSYQLDELSPIFVELKVDDNRKRTQLLIVGTAPALVSHSLWDTVGFVSTSSEPSPSKNAPAKMSFLASLPDEDLFATLKPSRKPILLDVPDKNNVHRYIVALMPTREVLEQLPQRFRSALETCYAPFIPGPVTYRNTRVNDGPATPRPWSRKVSLKKVTGLSGHPFIELDHSSLSNFGFVTDDVSICQNRSSVATIDTVTTSFVRSASREQVNNYVSVLRYKDSDVMRHIEGIDVPIGKLGTLVPDAGSSLEIHRSGLKDTVIPCFTSHTIRALEIDRESPFDWLDLYPLAQQFATEVANEIMNRRIPTDSLGYYRVEYGNQTIPVLKLLFGLRVATPWVSRLGWNGDVRRLVSISWYLPSQQVMNALPEDIRNFIQPEYEALYASIEHSQSLSEACNLLNRPSALGFCSIGDTTLRIDGVGPIPAHDALTLYVTSDLDALGTLQLIDGNGIVVQEQPGVSIFRGANEIPLSIRSTLPSGAYMVLLSTPRETRRSRILISR